MNRRIRFALFLLIAALLLGGCAALTVDEMYSPPKRSAEHQALQKAIDAAMPGLEYCAPLSGENQQTVQMFDLDGDGEEEYLLFAKGSSENPLRILVFGKSGEEYVLKETIDSRGSAFELVEYVDMDGQPGLELVVGCQLSNQVLRSLAVYTFSDGDSHQLMTANYFKFVTCDLDSNNLADLLVISPGAMETDHAVAALYSYRDGAISRSREADLSESADHIKRIMVENLHGGIPAVYVASSVAESAIITDVFAMKNGRFTNVSFSNESGTSVQTLRNYYVYADDIDSDGVLELPSLITMVPRTLERSVSRQHLIRWYAMDISGGEVDKMYTFHNLADGWYLQLDSEWAPRVTVTQEGSTYSFYMWDESFEDCEAIMTIYALTGSDREMLAVEDSRFILYRADKTIYAARLEDAAASYALTQERLISCFHLIYQDWKTGETE